MRVAFTRDGWRDYLRWVENDRRVLGVLNRLVEDVWRLPFAGLGKPEPVKGEVAGWWSRRITAEHRLVYRVEGRNNNHQVVIVQCRHHY